MQNNNKEQSSDSKGTEQTDWQMPGILLRKARREKSLDEEYVCKELGLRPGMLKALEGDDFERLPADIYVRGYIRSYCNLLGIDEQPVLSSLEYYRKQFQPDEDSADNVQEQAVLPWWRRAWLCWTVAVVVIAALLLVFTL